MRNRFRLSYRLGALGVLAVIKKFNMAADAIAVFMTAANKEEADRLADMLVSKHLAACVQILPQLESVYWWEGKIERQREVLLLAKTLASKFVEIEREVRAIHSYETPEIVAVPLTAGSSAYLAWLSASVAKDGELQS